MGLEQLKFEIVMQQNPHRVLRWSNADKILVKNLYMHTWCLVLTAAKLRNSVNGVRLAKKWFGKRYNQKTLRGKIQQLKAFFSSGTELRCKKTGDDNDLALALKSQDGTPLVTVTQQSTVIASYAWPNNLKMKFGDPCFVIPLAAGNRYTFGEKVASFAHELSHLVLNTDDLQVRNARGTQRTSEVYGADMAYALTIDNPDEALNSAENWGYYITAFREDVKRAEIMKAHRCQRIDKADAIKRTMSADANGQEWDMLTPRRVAWRRTHHPLVGANVWLPPVPLNLPS
jgi:hypothetical protein